MSTIRAACVCCGTASRVFRAHHSATRKRLSRHPPSNAHCSDVKNYTLLDHPGLRGDAWALYRDFVHKAVTGTGGVGATRATPGESPQPRLAFY